MMLISEHDTLKVEEELPEADLFVLDDSDIVLTQEYCLHTPGLSCLPFMKGLIDRITSQDWREVTYEFGPDSVIDFVPPGFVPTDALDLEGVVDFDKSREYVGSYAWCQFRTWLLVTDEGVVNAEVTHARQYVKLGPYVRIGGRHFLHGREGDLVLGTEELDEIRVIDDEVPEVPSWTGEDYV